MKEIKHVLGKINESGLQTQSWTSTTSTGSRSPKGAISPETGRLVNMVFTRFMIIYGHKFKSVFSSEDEIRVAKREWALSLGGYTEQELVWAVDRCKEQFVWTPTIAEFLALLRKDLQDYGLPAVLSAYEEACLYADHPREREWSHPAIYFAGRATDWFRLRTEDKFDVFADFEFNYRQFCQRVIDGEDLTVPLPLGLPDKSSNTLALFVQSWGEAQGVTPQQAATLLYYLEKPKNSPVRAHLKQHAELKASQWGLKLELPDDVSVT